LFLVWGPLHTPPCPAVFRVVRMADPKYADLPGIATDQPDTYETFSERGQDTVIAIPFLLFSLLISDVGTSLCCKVSLLLKALGV
jgi:hypothetical protein